MEGLESAVRIPPLSSAQKEKNWQALAMTTTGTVYDYVC